MGIIKCPILQDIAEYPIVFNNHFYDRDSLDTFRSGGNERSDREIASGYNEFARFFSRIHGLVAIYGLHTHIEFYFADAPPEQTSSP